MGEPHALDPLEDQPKEVHFTQYLMPDGRKTDVWIPVPDDVYKKAQEIESSGLRFEIEMLSDYKTISMTITEPNLEGEELDLDCHLCKNGPEVPETVQKMILGFDIERRCRG